MSDDVCAVSVGSWKGTSMLNEDYILKRMRPYLNANRELSAFEFSFLFSQLSKLEQYEVIDIMIANGIDYVDEKVEEKRELAGHSIPGESDRKKSESLQSLTALTNEELCVLYQEGNSAALASLVEKNQRFIMQYVFKCMKSFRRQCLTEDDLFQEGVFGVIKAAERFDSTLSFSFLTYCGDWIRQSITRAIVDSGFLIRLPEHAYEKVAKVAHYRRDNPLATETQLLEIIRQDGWNLSAESLRKYILYGEYYLNTTSLNTPVGEEDDTELLLFIPDDAALPEEIVEDQLRKEAISTVIETLTQREKDVLIRRFGLDGRAAMTLEQIGEFYQLTRERIRQIEVKALKKLRHPSRSKALRMFMETG